MSPEMSLSTIAWPQSTGAGVVAVSNGVPGAGVVTGGAVVFLAGVAGVVCRVGIVVGRVVVFGLVMGGFEGEGGRTGSLGVQETLLSWCAPSPCHSA